LLPADSASPDVRVGDIDPLHLVRAAWRTVLADVDSLHGGFGWDEKYVATPELDLVIALARRGSPRATAVLTRFLEGIRGTAIVDSVDGGLHRYSVSRDWSEPHHEKLLLVQAVVLDAIAAVVARDRAGDAATELLSGILRFIDHGLGRDSTELVHASLNADVLTPDGRRIRERGSRYYAKPGLRVSWKAGADELRRRPGRHPARDRTVYLASNARLAQAFIALGRATEDSTRIRAGLALRAAIVTDLRDGERYLRWRAGPKSGGAQAEDLAELGLLHLAVGDLEAARRVADELVDGHLVAAGGIVA